MSLLVQLFADMCSSCWAVWRAWETKQCTRVSL